MRRAARNASRTLAVAAALVAGACAPGPEPGEAEIVRLLEEVLAALKAGDSQRLQGYFVRDPRYEGTPPGAVADTRAERLRLSEFCLTPGFDYDPPRPQVAVLRNRAVMTFDLTYRFRLRQERVERQMRVTLFLERRPEGWRILRDSITFPLETQMDAGG